MSLNLTPINSGTRFDYANVHLHFNSRPARPELLDMSFSAIRLIFLLLCFSTGRLQQCGALHITDLGMESFHLKKQQGQHCATYLQQLQHAQQQSVNTSDIDLLDQNVRAMTFSNIDTN